MHTKDDIKPFAEEFVVSKLESSFDRPSFSCGIEQLDNFIKKYALLNQERNLGQTYVLHIFDSKSILGYYTISAANVNKNDFPVIEKIIKHLPNYPVPCILIAKLAVDKSHKGHGLGKYLLYDALKRSKDISSSIGCFAVILDALESSSLFYEKYGFIKFINRPLSYFLPIKTIEMINE